MSRLLFILMLSFILSSAFASPLTEDQVPEPLKPWVNWVLLDDDTFQCPFFYNNHQQKQCSWPASLSLELQSRQGNFISQWQVYTESWIALPGNSQFWPQNVTANNKPVLVMNQQGKPSVKLSPGSYQIKGDFYWDHIPENLAIPKNTGLFNLKINNKNIPFPSIKKNYIWLRESDIGLKKPKSVENKVQLNIFRKVLDTVPLQLLTHLELEVSGDQREILISQALLADFIPISLTSPLPARIEANGSLLIQVRPGRWQVQLNARHPKPVTQLTFSVNDKNWPQTEIWSFNSVPHLRVVEINNLKSIDPSLTHVPNQWKNLPAFIVNQGDSMIFKVIRRGDPDPEPNHLRLMRELWLGFNGDAYTVYDTMTGKMTRDWRINALPETQVGQIQLNEQNQLVTLSTDSKMQGIEIRKGNLNLKADSRINGSISTISAVGWSQTFDSVETILNLPPGWRLLAVSGADNDPDSWISQWTLLDLFLVLIAALAISRLWTIYWGIFALITLALCWHEPGAPHFIWLNILAAIALIRVLPDGTFKKTIHWYRNLCGLALLVIIIPFMVTQVRTGLYPQIEKLSRPSSVKGYTGVSGYAQSQSMENSIRVENSPVGVFTPKVQMSSIPLADTLGRSPAKNRVVNRVDPDASVQTGPGLPQWQWNRVFLSWNGSVDQQQKIRFWYLSPTTNMLFNFCRALLVLMLALLMFDLAYKKFKFSLSAFSWLLIIPLISTPAQEAYADFPDPKLLEELKARLLQAPDCLPSCAQIPAMNLDISPLKLDITLQVHAQQALAIPLPAKLDQWFPNQVKVDGQTAEAMLKTDDGGLWISLEPGFHTIHLRGVNPVQNKFSIPLRLKPHLTKITAKGWNITGLHENGRIDNQLIFTRSKTAEQLQAGLQKIEAGVFPAFIRIERRLELGLDWHIITRIVRVYNKNNVALSLSIPLLKGESVTSPSIQVKDNQVLVNMSPRQQVLEWKSVMEKTTQINLQAAETHQWTEVWYLDLSPIWHVESSGISVIHHQNQNQNRWISEWHPWPGEKVQLTISRPKAVAGSTLTIDSSKLKFSPGKRSLDTELYLVIRSSKGTQHKITIPEHSQLQFVNVNGTIQPIRQKGNEVSLPIKPGKQYFNLAWQKIQDQSIFLTTDAVDLGHTSVNSSLNILMSKDRWILFTSGPKLGPAVLFWGVLIVIALFSIGLGKVSLTPLKHWHWFLLLIGLSQIDIIATICVTGWLFALGLREKKPNSEPSSFNAIQIGLGLLTLVSLVLLFVAVQQGLLGSPDMQIAGYRTSAFDLNWYQDRSDKTLPTATVVSVPIMAYRILMLLWSLWLAISLLNWLKWGWSCFSSNGLWKKKQATEPSSNLMNNDTNK